MQLFSGMDQASVEMSGFIPNRTSTSKLVTSGRETGIELSIATFTNDPQRLQLMCFEVLRSANRKAFEIECMSKEDVEKAVSELNSHLLIKETDVSTRRS